MSGRHNPRLPNPECSPVRTRRGYRPEQADDVNARGGDTRERGEAEDPLKTLSDQIDSYADHLENLFAESRKERKSALPSFLEPIPPIRSRAEEIII